MIKAIIHNLIHSGIPKNANYQLLAGSRLLNISSLFLAVTYTIPAIILAPIIHDFYFTSMGIAMGLGFVLPFFFHRLGLQVLSKVVYIFYLNIVIFIVSSSLGEDYHVQITFLLHAGIALMFFDSKQYFLRVISVIFPIILFILLEYIDYRFFPKVNLSSTLKTITYSMVWIVIDVFFILIIYNSLLVRKKIIEELGNKKNQLKDTEKKLKAKDEKLTLFANDLNKLWNNFQEMEITYQEEYKNKKLALRNNADESQEDKLEIVIIKLHIIQEQMKESYKKQQQFVEMVENSFDFIALADFKGTLLYINEEGKKMVGLNKDRSLKDLKVVDLMQKKTGEVLYRKILPQIVTKGFWKGELDLKNIETGEIIYTDVSTFIIRDKKTQESLAWATIQKDITKRKKTEAELTIIHENLKKLLERERKNREALAEAHQNLKNTQSKLVLSEKMASLGQLTAGIAHEINNPMNFVYAGGDALKESVEELIQIIMMYSTLDNEENIRDKLNKIKDLKRELEYPALINDIRNLLDDVRVGAERTIEIVNSLKLFSRSEDEQMRQHDIHLALDATVVMLKGITVGNVTFVKKYEADLPQIDCFTGQISQVFMNVIGNAIHAIEKEEEGFIEITTKNFPKKITISIKDNGEGMTQETKKRIFEPFFTTKEIGKGTGLGMSISYGIIEKHHGSIEIKSQRGEGAEFIITIPKINFFEKK